MWNDLVEFVRQSNLCEIVDIAIYRIKSSYRICKEWKNGIYAFCFLGEFRRKWYRFYMSVRRIGIAKIFSVTVIEVDFSDSVPLFDSEFLHDVIVCEHHRTKRFDWCHKEKWEPRCQFLWFVTEVKGCFLIGIIGVSRCVEERRSLKCLEFLIIECENLCREGIFKRELCAEVAYYILWHIATYKNHLISGITWKNGCCT